MFSHRACGTSDGRQGREICELVLVLQYYCEPRRERYGTRGDEGPTTSRYVVDLADSSTGTRISFITLVEGRLYTESMTLGATTKSNPSANKIDETELERLRKQDYWLVVTRNKLLLDLVFVCEFPSSEFCLTTSQSLHSVGLLRCETGEDHSTNAYGVGCCLLEVCGNHMPLSPIQHPGSNQLITARGSFSLRRVLHSPKPSLELIPTFRSLAVLTGFLK